MNIGRPTTIDSILCARGLLTSTVILMAYRKLAAPPVAKVYIDLALYGERVAYQRVFGTSSCPRAQHECQMSYV